MKIYDLTKEDDSIDTGVDLTKPNPDLSDEERKLLRLKEIEGEYEAYKAYYNKLFWFQKLFEQSPEAKLRELMALQVAKGIITEDEMNDVAPIPSYESMAKYITIAVVAASITIIAVIVYKVIK